MKIANSKLRWSHRKQKSKTLLLPIPKEIVDDPDFPLDAKRGVVVRIEGDKITISHNGDE